MKSNQKPADLKEQILSFGDNIIGESLWALTQSLALYDEYLVKCTQMSDLIKYSGKEYKFMRKTYRRLKGVSRDSDNLEEFKENLMLLTALYHHQDVENAGIYYVGDKKFLLEELAQNIPAHTSNLRPSSTGPLTENEEIYLKCFKNFVENIKPALFDPYGRLEISLSYISGELNPFIPKKDFFLQLSLQLNYYSLNGLKN